VPSWSDAGSRVARDDVAASRFPQRSAAEQAHKPCVVVRLLHTPALFRHPRLDKCSRCAHTHSHRVCSQLASVVHLTPRTVLRLPCSRLPFAALPFYRWRELRTRAAPGSGYACHRMPNAPTPGPLFFAHHRTVRKCMQDAAWHGMNSERTRPTVLSDVRYPDAHPHVQIPFSAYAPPPPVNHVDRAWLVARGLSVASCSSHVTEPHPCCPMQKNHVAKVIVSRFREIIWNHARKAWPHAATRFVMNGWGA